MDEEIYSFALKTTLNEIQNICPDMKNYFMFKEDGKIVARDENTPKKVAEQIVDSFNGIMDKAEAIGGLERLTLEGDNGRVNILSMSNIYILTVTSRGANMDYINTVTNVLIPTMLKLLDKINPASLNSKIIDHTEPEEIEEELQTEEPEEIEEILQTEEPESLTNQLVIEDLGGLLVPSDTVRIDSGILSQWEEYSELEDDEIEEVEIETFDGKTTKCKVRPIKDSKYKDKGIIRIPEKIQHDLDIKKGELIRVKPAVD